VGRGGEGGRRHGSGGNREEGGGRAKVVRTVVVARDGGDAAAASGGGLIGVVAAAPDVELGFGAIRAGAVATVRTSRCKGLWGAVGRRLSRGWTAGDGWGLRADMDRSRSWSRARWSWRPGGVGGGGVRSTKARVVRRSIFVSSREV
jgi:hypothetical protein